MILPGETVLIGVSGGPDSVLLLHALINLKNKLKIKRIAVCHLDHGLRGSASASDAEFVKRMAQDAGLDYYHRKADLTGDGSKKLSTEELARDVRYAFYAECAARSGASAVATGHTLDDQAETVIMRIVKGTSLKGAAGIPPVRHTGGVKFMRPLLEIEKSEIAAYLDGQGIDYRIDRTNLENIYFRNIVRSEILPFLAKYNPRIRRALSNFAEHLREDFEFIDSHRSKACGIIGTEEPSGEVSIQLKDLVVQPRALQKEILRDSLKERHSTMAIRKDS